MAFRVKDVKLLWSKAGGRCSMAGCRLPLTAQGEPATLGDMAHIKGENQGSARFEAAMTDEERNAYGNLILLCPTHHREIDRLVDEWSVDKLDTTKTAHELWVRERLDRGEIAEPSLEGVAFVEERAGYWGAKEHSWLVLAVTPLQVKTAAAEFDPVRKDFAGRLRETIAPSYLEASVNPYLARPSENGLVYEDFRNLAEGIAVAVEVFRSGHAEYALCLDFAIGRATSSMSAAKPPTAWNPWRVGAERYLFWHYLKNSVRAQVGVLRDLWQLGLPFDYAQLSAFLTRSRSLAMLTEEFWPGIPPRPVEGERLLCARVVERGATAAELEDALLVPLVESFGLTLRPFNQKGRVETPQTL